MRSMIVFAASLLAVAALCVGMLRWLSPPPQTLLPEPAATAPTTPAAEQAAKPAPTPVAEPEPVVAPEPAGESTATADSATVLAPSETANAGGQHGVGEAVLTGQVVDGTGNPLAEVEVTCVFLEVADDVRERVEALELEEFTARTDTRGQFQITNLPEGEVQLLLLLDGYTPGPHAAQTFATDARDIQLVMDRSARVHGTVKDMHGGLVADAHLSVSVATEESTTGSSTQVGTAKTDEAGQYEITDLHPGLITVSIRHNEMASDSVMVELAPGESYPLDFTLEEGLTITGFVIDDLGDPVAGATIAGSVLADASMKDMRRDSETGADGTFRLIGLEPALYKLDVTAAGFTWTEGQNIAAGSTEVKFVLKRESRVTGRVVDPDDRPVAGASVSAEVTLASSTPWSSESHSSESTTDDDGHFDITSLQPGALVLVADHADWLASEPYLSDLTSGQLIEDIVLVVRPGVTISGVVVDTAGQPVAGAAMSAQQARGTEAGFVRSASYGGRHSSSSGAVTTDAQGKFTIKGLETGSSYRIAAHKDGYVDPDSDTGTGNATAPATGIVITLQVAAKVSGIVLLPDSTPAYGAQIVLTEKGKQMWNGGRSEHASSDEDGAFSIDTGAGEFNLSASLSGYQASEQLPLVLGAGQVQEGLTLILRAGGEIRGRVIDEDNQPVAGATVSGWNQGAAMSGQNDYLNSTSAEDGTFTLAGTSDGTYMLSAEHADFVSNQTAMWMPGAKKVTARAGDMVEIRLLRGATLTGQVVDRSGKPVVAYQLEVMGTQPAMQGMEMTLKSESIAAPDGRFEVRAVDKDSKAVVVTAAGYARARVKIDSIATEGYTDLGIIRISAGATVSGRVRTTGGQAVQGATVNLNSTADAKSNAFGAMGQGMLSAQTAEDGTYEIANVPASEHELSAVHQDFARASKTIKVPADGKLTAQDLSMSEGGSVFGFVLGTGGKPETGSGVVAMPAGGGGMFGMGQDSKNTTTDDEGRYRVSGLRPGKYMVMVNKDGGGFGMNNRTRTVDVPEGGEVELNFTDESLCRLFGRVIGFRSDPEAPMGNMLMLLSLSGGAVNQAVAQIEEDGSYSFEPMPAGEYQVMVAGRTTTPLTLPAAPEFRHDIELPNASISGVVTREDGEPIGMVEVRGMRRGGGSMLSRFAQANTDAEGSYRLEGMRDGTYDVYVELSGIGTGVTEGVVIAGGASVPGVDVLVRIGGKIKVRIIDAAGRPVSAAMLYCQDAQGNPIGLNGNPFGAGGGDENGVQMIEGLAPGVYRVIAGTPTDGTVWRDGVNVSTSAEATVELRLGRQRGKISVDVTQAGAPVAGVALALIDSTGHTAIDVGGGFLAVVGGSSTDSEGNYTSGFMPAGNYTLRLDRSGEVLHTREVVIPSNELTLDVTVQLP